MKVAVDTPNNGQTVAVRTLLLDPETFVISWEIKNYTSLMNTPVVKSTVLPGGPSGHTWQLEVYPNHLENDRRYFGAYLSLVDFGPGFSSISGKLNSRIDFHVVDAIDMLALRFGGAKHELRRGKSIGWSQVTFANVITNPDYNLLKNDTLSVAYKITLPRSYSRVTPETTGNTSVDRKLAILQQFRASMEPDVAIKAATTIFKRHRQFLKATCPALFSRTKTHKRAEFATVDLSNHDDDIVLALLDYIYEGETHLLTNPGKVSKLLKLAREVRLEKLRLECEAAIWGNCKVTVETALDDLLVAHDAEMEELKKSCLNFIKENIQAVKHSKSYRRHLESQNTSVLLELIMEIV